VDPESDNDIDDDGMHENDDDDDESTIRAPPSPALDEEELDRDSWKEDESEQEDLYNLGKPFAASSNVFDLTLINKTLNYKMFQVLKALLSKVDFLQTACLRSREWLLTTLPKLKFKLKKCIYSSGIEQ
jgi:hypothetical protein